MTLPKMKSPTSDKRKSRYASQAPLRQTRRGPRSVARLPEGSRGCTSSPLAPRSLRDRRARATGDDVNPPPSLPPSLPPAFDSAGPGSLRSPTTGNQTMPKDTLAVETAMLIVEFCRPRRIKAAKIYFLKESHPVVQQVAKYVQTAIDQSQPSLTHPEITPFVESADTEEPTP